MVSPAYFFPVNVILVTIRQDTRPVITSKETDFSTHLSIILMVNKANIPLKHIDFNVFSGVFIIMKSRKLNKITSKK